uniref:Uncharacterized protein n=1 Tax=Elaeophora elaphi TaxID=1147741 RepID=A0A0R3RLH4_9BILA
MQGSRGINQIELALEASPHQPSFACYLYPWTCGLNHSQQLPNAVKIPFNNITNTSMTKIPRRVGPIITEAPKIVITETPTTKATTSTTATTTTTAGTTTTEEPTTEALTTKEPTTEAITTEEPTTEALTT